MASPLTEAPASTPDAHAEGRIRSAGGKISKRIANDAGIVAAPASCAAVRKVINERAFQARADRTEKTMARAIPMRKIRR